MVRARPVTQTHACQNAVGMLLTTTIIYCFLYAAFSHLAHKTMDIPRYYSTILMVFFWYLYYRTEVTLSGMHVTDRVQLAACT